MNRDSEIPNILDANIVTCSFRGDLEICRLLCVSFDRFVPDSFVHSLYVPAADVPLFADLETRRRRVMTQESLLPFWFRKAPLPPPRWRERLFLPRRNVYLTPFSLPVRGWIAQQIMKISATLASEHEVVAHIDSDTAFVRPLSMADLTRGDKVRFCRDQQVLDFPAHRQWYKVAGRLVGLPEGDHYHAGYIQNLVVWRRSVVEALTKRIEATTGRDWLVTLARTPHFAEYVLYGLFVDYVLGPQVAGLYAESQPLVHSRWSDRIEGAAQTAAFVDGLRHDHVAYNVQSTSGMTIEERTQIYSLLAQRALEQDALAPKA